MALAAAAASDGASASTASTGPVGGPLPPSATTPDAVSPLQATIKPSPSSASASSPPAASTTSSVSKPVRPRAELKDRPPRPRVTRTRRGCLTCRARRKKCDGENEDDRDPVTGGCMRCRRAGFECLGFPPLKRVPGQPSAPDHDSTIAAPYQAAVPMAAPSLAPAANSVTEASGRSARFSPYPRPEVRRCTTSQISFSAAAPDSRHQLPRDASLSPTASSVPNTAQNMPILGLNVAAGQMPLQMESACPTVGDCLLSGRSICGTCLSAIQPSNLSTEPLPMPAAPAMPPGDLNTHVLQRPLPMDTNWCFDQTVDVGARHSMPPPPPGMMPPGGGGTGTPLAAASSSSFFAAPSMPLSAQGGTEPSHPLNVPGMPSSVPTGSSALPGTPWPSTKESILGYYGAVITCWVEGCHPSQIGRSRLFEGVVRSLFAQIDTRAYVRLSVAAVAACYIGGDQLRWPDDLSLIQRWSAGLRRDSLELPRLQPPAPEKWDRMSPPGAPTAPGTSGVSSGSDGQHPSVHTQQQQTLHQHLDRHLTSYSYHLRRMATQAVDDELNAVRAGPLTWPDPEGKIGLEMVKRYDSLILAAMNLAIFDWAEVGIDAFFASLDEAIRIAHLVLGGNRRLCWSKCHEVETLGTSMLVWADASAAIARGTRPYFILEVEDSNEFPKHARPRGQPTSSTLAADEADSEHFPLAPFNCPDPLLKCLSDIAHLRSECDVTASLGERAFNPNLPPFSAASLAAMLDGATDGAVSDDDDDDDEDDDDDDEDSLTNSPKRTSASAPGSASGVGLHDGDMGGELRDVRGEASLGKHLAPHLRRRAQAIQRALGSRTMLSVTRAQSYYGSPGCAEMVRLAAQLLLYQSVFRVGPLFPAVRRCVRQVLHVWSNSQFALVPETQPGAPSFGRANGGQTTWHGAREFCVAVGCGNYLFPVFMAASAATTADERDVFRDALMVIGHNEAAPSRARDAVRKAWTATRRTGFYVHPLLDLVPAGHAKVGFF